jgi:hypothetical protein
MHFLRKYHEVKEIAGCEPYPWAAERCRDLGLDVSCSTIEFLTTYAKYDIILCMDVLVLAGIDPAECMSSLSKLMKPESVLIMNVAAFPCLARNHDLRNNAIRRYTIRSFKKSLVNTPLVIEQYFYWNIAISPVLLLQAIYEKIARDANPAAPVDLERSDLKPPNRIASSLINLLMLAEDLLPMRLRQVFGSSLFVVARKSG